MVERYEASWMLPTDQQDETGKQGMGRSDSIWNEMNVIGVTEGIYNDTVAISKESQYYTPEIVAALQDCFINIIGTDERQGHLRRLQPHRLRQGDRR